MQFSAPSEVRDHIRPRETQAKHAAPSAAVSSYVVLIAGLTIDTCESTHPSTEISYAIINRRDSIRGAPALPEAEEKFRRAFDEGRCFAAEVQPDGHELDFTPPSYSELSRIVNKERTQCELEFQYERQSDGVRMRELIVTRGQELQAYAETWNTLFRRNSAHRCI